MCAFKRMLGDLDVFVAQPANGEPDGLPRVVDFHEPPSVSPEVRRGTAENGGLGTLDVNLDEVDLFGAEEFQANTTKVVHGDGSHLDDAVNWCLGLIASADRMCLEQ